MQPFVTCTCNAKIYQQKCFQLWIMIIPVINVYLNLPPLIKVRAFIQKNGKYIYHLVGGMIPNFLRTCFSWDSIKLFSDGTLFLPLRFVLMTKTLPPKRSWTPKKSRSVWQQQQSELGGQPLNLWVMMWRHPIQPHHARCQVTCHVLAAMITCSLHHGPHARVTHLSMLESSSLQSWLPKNILKVGNLILLPVIWKTLFFW